ncbi:hypothetical protein Lalb_Chr18g0050681 [Lupinus albus]|uniref:Uncharacterized protein n=1 Tax=Lupinus albus TaxID=3870 RepID=A0A6A4NPS7_LUPAL|nr:hypothetical protein Lalb_Chr18g0050681 [Lupinus albus]
MTSKTYRFSTCHRHPIKPLTGFCASCLRERLTGIESSSATVAADDYLASESLPVPEIRRTKSCSGNAAEAPSSSSAVLEPRRRSYEVSAVRSTLCDLFNVGDAEKNGPNRKPEIDSGKSGLEINEEKENEENGNNGGEGIMVWGNGFACFEDDEERKTMKEFIDLEFQSRKNSGIDFREIAGSFCKRLRKWKQKQKVKKNCCDGNGNGHVRTRRLKETQSEVGEYGLLGRRSCDTDPRLSIDAARMLLDGYGYDPQFSFEARQASWEGYLIGKACPFSPMVHVNGVLDDNRVLVEEEEGVNLESVGEHCPGGSVQTKDYYSDSHGRRSFDKSNSRRKLPTADVDDLRVVSNAKVSPATTELFYGAKVLVTKKDLGDGNMNTVQSECVIASASKDASDVTRFDLNGFKNLHRWRRLWNKLGLVQRRREERPGEEYGAGDMVSRPGSESESWQKLRRVVNGQASGLVSQKLIRSYSVSCQNSCRSDGLVNGLRHRLNGRQELMIHRDRSIRHSPNNADNGLLRFYLTPLKSYRGSRSGRSGLKDLNPTARSLIKAVTFENISGCKKYL